MPGLYRCPLYGFLGLFFIYPSLLPALEAVVGPGETWMVSFANYLFAIFGAALFLTLIPAIRRGGDYARDNGTPWKWPWFPWVVFGILALAVGVRSYLLGLSFYPAWRSGSPFMPYFLTPLILALGVLILEAGIRSGRSTLVRGALLAPVLGVLFCLFGKPAGRLPADFLEVYMGILGPPVLLGAVLAFGFYAYAWFRHVKEAEAGLVFALLALSTIGDRTLSPATLAVPRMLPLAAIASPPVLAGDQKPLFLACPGRLDGGCCCGGLRTEGNRLQRVRRGRAGAPGGGGAAGRG